MFLIEDELHSERQDGDFPTFDAAIAELQRRATIPWNEPPNVAPCQSWRTCGRNYEVIEYDASERRAAALPKPACSILKLFQ
jgi:hypothetical protein